MACDSLTSSNVLPRRWGNTLCNIQKEMSLLFSCRFLGQVKLIINAPRKREPWPSEYRCGKGVRGKERHQNELETFHIHDRFITFDRPIISTWRTFTDTLYEKSLLIKMLSNNNNKTCQWLKMITFFVCLPLFLFFFFVNFLVNFFHFRTVEKINK